MDRFRNHKLVSDKYDSDYIREVSETNIIVDDTVDPNETFNSNLDSAVEDLDDIRTSISQKPVNPLYIEDSSSVCKIALPKASLVEDDRFWRDQVSHSDEMANKLREAKAMQKEVEALEKEIQEAQIVTLASTTSSSPDSFTPFKTIKDRIPDAITRWSVTLLHGNLLIVGQDKDGKKPMARVCKTRVSSYIFHDSNNIVCSLCGPSDPDNNVPKYILDKFKMGIPADWQIVIQYWRDYKSLNCPVKFNWPPLPHSAKYDQTTNWYENPDTDTSFVDSGRMSSTAQQLTKKIAKMQRMLRATLLKESFSNSRIRNSILNSTQENSIRNNSLSNKKNSSILDSVLVRTSINNNHLSNSNCAINPNLSASASKVQNVASGVPTNKSNLFSSTNIFEKVSFHKKPAEPIENSLESEVSDFVLNKSSTSESLHLEPLISEESHTKAKTPSENHKQKKSIKVNSENNKFSSSNNKKIATKKLDTVKTSEKSSSFVSLNLSKLSKLSSLKEVEAGQNSSKKKDLNVSNKSKCHITETDIRVSSRGRTTVSALPFWKGSRLLVEKDGTKLISSLNNPTILNDFDLFRKSQDIDTLPKRNRKKADKSQSETIQCVEKYTDFVPNKINSEVFLKPSNIDTIQNLGRKKVLQSCQEDITADPEELPKLRDTETTKKRGRKKAERSQSESSPDESTKLILNQINSEEVFKSPVVETVKNRGRNKSRTERSQSEFSPDKSTKLISNRINSEVLKSPADGTIKNRGRNKSRTERSQSESSPDKSTKLISNRINSEEVFKSPVVETVKNRGRNKSRTERSQSEFSPDKSTKLISNRINSEVLKSPADGTIKNRGRNKSRTERSQSESSPDKSTKLISNRINSEEVFKSPVVETVKNRGRNKSRTERSQSESSPEKSTKLISNRINSEEVFKSPVVETVKNRGRNKSRTERSQSESSPDKSTKLISNRINSEEVFKSPVVETVKNRGRNKSRTERSQSEFSPDKSTKLISNRINSEVLKSPANETIKNRGRNKSQTDRSQSESSPDKSTKLISNRINSEEVFKSPVVEIIKNRGRNKSRTETSQSEYSSDKSTKLISNRINSEDFLKSTDGKIKNRGRNKSRTERSQSESSPHKSTKLISNSFNSADYFNSPVDGTIKKHGKKNGQFESSLKEITDVIIPNSNNFNEFLKPPDIESIKKKHGRKKRWTIDTTNNVRTISNISDSNISNVGSPMSGQSQAVSEKSQTSLGELSLFSGTSNSNLSISSSVSSRGRRRVSTLPFWQGHRLTIYKQEVVIQQSTTLRCNIDRYVNDDTSSINSTDKKTPKKTKPNQDSPVSSYEHALKKPGPYSKTVEKPLIKMQLMSTLRDSFNDDTIQNNQSPSRINSPFKKQINHAVKNSSNQTKSKSQEQSKVISPTRSANKARFEIVGEEINTKRKKREEKFSTPSPVRKHTSKKLKQLKNATVESKEISETNENLISQHSMYHRITRSAKRKQYDEESQKNNQSSQTKQLKNHVIVDENTSSRKRTRYSVKKLFEEESEINNIPVYINNKTNETQEKNIKTKVTKPPKYTAYNTKANSKRNNSDFIKDTDESESETEREYSKRYVTRKTNYNDEKSPIKNNKKTFNSSPVSKQFLNSSVDVEKDIPNGRNKKELAKLTPKQSSQSKDPKKRKSSQFIVPTDPNQLYVLINKHKKSKKTVPKSEVTPLSKEPVKETENVEPKKRKMFLNKDWLNSEKCLDILTQNNVEEEKSRSKFCLTVDSNAHVQESDEFSEVSALY